MYSRLSSIFRRTAACAAGCNGRHFLSAHLRALAMEWPLAIIAASVAATAAFHVLSWVGLKFVDIGLFPVVMLLLCRCYNGGIGDGWGFCCFNRCVIWPSVSTHRARFFYFTSLNWLNNQALFWSNGVLIASFATRINALTTSDIVADVSPSVATETFAANILSACRSLSDALIRMMCCLSLM